MVYLKLAKEVKSTIIHPFSREEVGEQILLIGSKIYTKGWIHLVGDGIKYIQTRVKTPEGQVTLVQVVEQELNEAILH